MALRLETASSLSAERQSPSDSMSETTRTRVSALFMILLTVAICPLDFQENGLMIDDESESRSRETSPFVDSADRS